MCLSIIEYFAVCALQLALYFKTCRVEFSLYFAFMEFLSCFYTPFSVTTLREFHTRAFHIESVIILVYKNFVQHLPSELK